MKHSQENLSLTAAISFRKLLDTLLSPDALQDSGKEALLSIKDIEEDSFNKELEFLSTALDKALAPTPLKGSFSLRFQEIATPKKHIRLSLSVNEGHAYAIHDLTPYKEKIVEIAAKATREAEKATEQEPKRDIIPEFLFDQMFDDSFKNVQDSQVLRVISTESQELVDLPTLNLSLRILNHLLGNVLQNHGMPRDAFFFCFGSYQDVAKRCNITNPPEAKETVIALGTNPETSYTLKHLLSLKNEISQGLKRWKDTQSQPEYQTAAAVIRSLSAEDTAMLLMTISQHLPKKVKTTPFLERKVIFGINDRRTHLKAKKHKEAFNHALQTVLTNHGIPTDTFAMTTPLEGGQLTAQIEVKKGSGYTIDTFNDLRIEVLLTLQETLFLKSTAAKTPTRSAHGQNSHDSLASKHEKSHSRKTQHPQENPLKAPRPNSKKTPKKQAPTHSQLLPPPSQLHQNAEMIFVHGIASQLCETMSAQIKEGDAASDKISFTLNAPKNGEDAQKLKKAMALLLEASQSVLEAHHIAKQDITLDFLEKNDGRIEISSIRNSATLSWSMIHTCMGEIEETILSAASAHTTVVSQHQAPETKTVPPAPVPRHREKKTPLTPAVKEKAATPQSPYENLSRKQKKSLDSFASRLAEDWKHATPPSERIKPAFDTMKWQQLLKEQRASAASSSMQIEKEK